MSQNPLRWAFLKARVVFKKSPVGLALKNPGFLNPGRHLKYSADNGNCQCRWTRAV